MAIYHLTVKHVSRGKGGKVVASAAYRSGQRLKDARYEAVHDYSRRSGVAYCEILTPQEVPAWATDRETLWNEVERSEKRKDAQLAMEVEVALPRELDIKQNATLVHRFVQDQFVNRGMIADVAIHEHRAADGGTNPHAHILLTTRDVTAAGFGRKNIAWCQKETLLEYRQTWADACNNALEEAGSAARVDHRTLKEQGILREPSIHLGREASGIERRGSQSDRNLAQASPMDRALAPFRKDLADQGMISMPAITQSPNWWERAVDMALYARDRLKEGIEAARSRWQNWANGPDEPAREPSR